MKRISDIGLKKLKEFEGLRKEAYYDAAGVPTIGYGHTKGVRMGDVISEYWAEMFLKADLYDVEKQVDSLGLKLNQPQFDALVSFAFNLGFYKLKTSTLLKTIQEVLMSHRSSQIAQIFSTDCFLIFTDYCSINAAPAQRKSVR